MERVTLEIEARETGGSPAARALRRTGMIPGVLYGNGRDPQAICVDPVKLRTALNASGGRHSILDVQAPGEKKAVPAILKELQLHPVRDTLIHFDLFEVRMDQAMQTFASVHLIGEPHGVKMQGGVLDQPTHEIGVEGLPALIPDHIDVDVSGLEVGQSIKVADLTPPEGITWTSDADLVVASVVAPTELEEPEVEEGEELEGEAAEAGEAPDGESAPEPDEG